MLAGVLDDPIGAAGRGAAALAGEIVDGVGVAKDAAVSTAKGIATSVASTGQRAAGFAGDLFGHPIDAALGIVNQARDFANRQIDRLLRPLAGAAETVGQFGAAVIARAEGFVQERIARIASRAAGLRDNVMEAVDWVSTHGPPLLGRVRDFTQRRIESLRAWKARFRQRRQDIRLVKRRVVAEILQTLEDELERDAVELETLGAHQWARTGMVLEALRDNTQRHLTILGEQTEAQIGRVRSLVTSLNSGRVAIRDWVRTQRAKVLGFVQSRIAAAMTIRDPREIESWAATSVAAAVSLATEVGGDLVLRRRSVLEFAEGRRNDAAAILDGLGQQFDTVLEWRRENRAIRRSAVADVRETLAKVRDLMRTSGARAVGRTHQVALQGMEELTRLKREDGSDPAREAEAIYEDLQNERREFEREIGVATLEVDLPATEHSEKTVEPKFQNAHEDRSEVSETPPGETPREVENPAPRSVPRTGPAAPSKLEVPVKPTPVHAEAEYATSKATTPSLAATHIATPNESQTFRSDQATIVPVPPTVDASAAVPRSVPAAEPILSPQSRVKKGESVPPMTPRPQEGKPSSTFRPTDRKRDEPAPKAAKQTTPGVPTPPGTQNGEGVRTQATRQDALVEKAETIRSEPAPKPLEADHAQPKPTIQRRGTGPQPVADAGALRKSLTAASAGAPLSSDVRQTLGGHVGFDPSMVRVHSGGIAAAAARALNAEAFTIGHDVFFAQDRFDPTSPKGLGLIGHEVTHVGQQLGKRGDRAQMHSRSGGDAMEQEAQAAGARIERDLAYASSLRVARFVRHYEPEGDGAIEPADATRLDAISTQALRKAGRLLAQSRRPRSLRIDQLDVEVSLDLAEMSDDEAADAWAEAIVAAAEAHAANVRRETEIAPPATRQLLQREGTDPAKQAALDSIRATDRDHDLVRKAAIREKVDPMIESSKAKQRDQDQKESQLEQDPGPGGRAAAAGRALARGAVNVRPEDRGAIEEILKEVGLNSLEEYDVAMKDFLAAFEAMGRKIVDYLLNENQRIIQEQQTRYLKEDELKSLRDAANRLMPALDAYIAEFNSDLGAAGERYPYLPLISPMTRDNYDDHTESGKRFRGWTDEEAKRLSERLRAFQDARDKEGDVHMILLNRDFDPSSVLGDGAAGVHLFTKVHEIGENVKYVRENMTNEKVWGMPLVVGRTKAQMGVDSNPGATKGVDEKVKTVANDSAISNALQAGAAIALAITAMVASGGLAAVALVGSAGLSVSGAAHHLSDYRFEDAASHSALDQAKVVSKDDPSLFWLALDLIGAGLDVGAALGAFKTLAVAAKAAIADRTAMKELEAAAKSAYAKLPTKQISEKDFVNRLLEAAGKGEAGGKLAAQQSRLLSELIEATSPRATAILRGDAKTIEEVVKEHRNWRGLVGGLQSGGTDAEKMAQEIGKYRNGLIEDLKARGARPLEDASADVASDFDLNVVGPDAGQKVIDFEKEMAGRFGESWSEALHLNFYTDRSQLLTYEEALKLVVPARRAQIVQRVTAQSEKYNFAKMLEHAGDNPQAIRELEETMKAAGVKYSLDDLRKVAADLHAKGREALLTEIDADLKALSELPAGDARRVAKAEAITEKQMQANFLSREAYIGPAAVRGGAGSMGEAYQQAVSQLEMLGHVVHDAGGNVPNAMRAYEFQKYVNRYVAAARRAGVNSPALDYFEGFSTFVYKRSRSANAATGHLPGGTTVADEASGVQVSESFLVDQYNAFRAEVDKTLPKIKANAAKDPAGGWKPEAQAPPGPTSAPMTARPGTPAPPPPGAPGGTGGNPSLPPGNVHEAAAARDLKTPARAITTPQGERTVMESAGSKSSATGANVGVFRANVAGVGHPVVIKVYRTGQRAQMEAELAAVHAAEKTGFGPHVYGVVDAGEGRVGFAMDEVSGGFADMPGIGPGKPGAEAAQAEIMRNARNITPQTYSDVANFRDKLWREGFSYQGSDLQGFVDAQGRWRPIDLQAAKPVPAGADEQAAAWSKHFDIFNDYLAQLARRQVEARAAAAGTGGQ